MLVKVFEAETMAAALKKVKETFGPEALILSTRTLRKGGLGLVGKPRIEITAAIESPAASGEEPAPQPAPRPASQVAQAYRNSEAEAGIETAERNWRRQPVIDPLEAELRELRELVSSQNLSELRSELDELKGVLRQVAGQARPPQAETPVKPVRPRPRRAGGSRQENLELLTSSLLEHAIEPQTAETLARYASEKLTPQQLCNPALINRFFCDTIGDLIRFSQPLGPQGDGQKRIALVGPTGVGKTTTLAKLAADYLHQFGGKAALLTIDTYRVAAVEQLRVYGEIMGLPVEAVYSPERLDAALERFSDRDLILIDTAGRSPRDEAGMAELCAFLGQDRGIEQHLVLAAGTRGLELADAVASFSRLPLASLIFTKLDECLQRGALLDIPLRKNLPLSYLTNGQRVPEDLLTAEPDLVAGFILGKH